MHFQDRLYSFLGDRVEGGFFVAFHSDLIKERLVEFYKRYFNTQGKRAIPLPLKIKNLKFLQMDCQNKTMVFDQYM